MIVLDTVNKSIRAVLTTALTPDVAFTSNYVDVAASTYVPGNIHGTTNGVVSVEVVAAPAVSTQRQVKFLSFQNGNYLHAGLTVYLLDGATTRILWKGDLGVLDGLTYTDGVGFEVAHGSTGARKITSANLGVWGDANLVSAFRQRIFATPQSRWLRAGPGTPYSGYGYWVYCGYMKTATIVNRVEFYVTSAGVGGQTAEVGLFYTDRSPHEIVRSNSTTDTTKYTDRLFRKLTATGTVDALTGTGMKRNTNAFNYTVAAGTHLWAGFRAVMLTTQPQLVSCPLGYAGVGQYVHSGPGALTGAGPWYAPLNVSGNMPDLRATMD